MFYIVFFYNWIMATELKKYDNLHQMINDGEYDKLSKIIADDMIAIYERLIKEHEMKSGNDNVEDEK